MKGEDVFSTRRKLKVIVYNKTRKYAGHTIEIVLSSRDTISTVKEKILEKTSIPVDIQHIVFGVDALKDDETLHEHHIKDGYTIYSTPTYVEIPELPNL
uniref:Ubiquitin-like domain-containing protein n=1 Tax=Ascaris lumbricoides TaxID=6252 RepID=A0A9J2PSA8_ASCLU